MAFLRGTGKRRANTFVPERCGAFHVQALFVSTFCTMTREACLISAREWRAEPEGLRCVGDWRRLKSVSSAFAVDVAAFLNNFFLDLCRKTRLIWHRMIAPDTLGRTFADALLVVHAGERAGDEVVSVLGTLKEASNLDREEGVDYR